MTAFQRLGKPQSKGARIVRRGYRLFYVGLAGIFIGGLGASAAHGSRPVIAAVLVVTFGVAVAGLGVVLAGRRIRNRDWAEYDRKVAAGEIQPWKPGDPNPLA